MSRYPEDEFDVAAHGRGPKGVHRQAEGALRRLLPFLVVLVLAPLLAWGTLSLLNQDSDDGGAAAPSPTRTATVTAEPTVAPTTAAPTPTPSASPTPSPEPAAVVDLAAPVAVLNGVGVQGIAGRAADRLVTAGFTAVTSADYRSAQPTESTVYYNNPALAATARAVGAELGIDLLIELPSASDSIAVVLRGDYQE